MLSSSFYSLWWDAHCRLKDLFSRPIISQCGNKLKYQLWSTETSNCPTNTLKLCLQSRVISSCGDIICVSFIALLIQHNDVSDITIQLYLFYSIGASIGSKGNQPNGKRQKHLQVVNPCNVISIAYGNPCQTCVEMFLMGIQDYWSEWHTLCPQAWMKTGKELSINIPDREEVLAEAGWRL